MKPTAKAQSSPINAEAEQVSGLQAALKELNIKAAEAARQYKHAFKAIDWDKTAESIRQTRVKLAGDFAKISESFRRFKTGLPDKLKTLAMHGWFIYGYRTPCKVIFPIASLFETGRIDEGNQAMCWHFNNVLSDIEADLTERFPKRALILKKAFAARRADNYELSIPVLLAQADGIARDTIGQGIRNFSITSKRHEIKHAIETFIGKNAKEELFAGEILGVVLLQLPLNVSEDNAMLSGEVLNRHQILHGANTAYATPLNSCRAISWLDYVSYFHTIGSECRTELLQKCEGECDQ
jgi:hypothetical protein